MHHQHLSQIAVERNIELQNRNKEDFYDLNYLELVSPQAYLVEACRLNLKEKIFEGIIYCLSTESAIYLSEASFQKEDNEIKFDKCRPFIDYVCFRYFNFQMALTKYRREQSSLGILEAAILLGFCDEVIEYLPSNQKFEIMYGFVKISRLIDFVAEGKKKNTSMDKQLSDKMETYKTITEYHYLDRRQANHWVEKIDKNVIITQAEKKEIENRIPEQAKKNRCSYEIFQKKTMAQFYERALQSLKQYNCFISHVQKLRQPFESYLLRQTKYIFSEISIVSVKYEKLNCKLQLSVKEIEEMKLKVQKILKVKLEQQAQKIQNSIQNRKDIEQENQTISVRNRLIEKIGKSKTERKQKAMHDESKDQNLDQQIDRILMQIRKSNNPEKLLELLAKEGMILLDGKWISLEQYQQLKEKLYGTIYAFNQEIKILNETSQSFKRYSEELPSNCVRFKQFLSRANNLLSQKIANDKEIKEYFNQSMKFNNYIIEKDSKQRAEYLQRQFKKLKEKKVYQAFKDRQQNMKNYLEKEFKNQPI